MFSPPEPRKLDHLECRVHLLHPFQVAESFRQVLLYLREMKSEIANGMIEVRVADAASQIHRNVSEGRVNCSLNLVGRDKQESMYRNCGPSMDNVQSLYELRVSLESDSARIDSRVPKDSLVAAGIFRSRTRSPLGL